MFLAPATQFPNNKIYNFLIRVCTSLVNLSLLKAKGCFQCLCQFLTGLGRPTPSWLTLLPFKSIESTEIDFVTFKGILEHIISCTGPEKWWVIPGLFECFKSTGCHLYAFKALSVFANGAGMLTCTAKAQGTVEKSCCCFELSVLKVECNFPECRAQVWAWWVG